jgi:hypothetical protein
MAIPRHLDEAAARLREAKLRIEVARSKTFTSETSKEWLSALTDFALAAADVQSFSNESVHEKLHELAARAGIKKL